MTRDSYDLFDYDSFIRPLPQVKTRVRNLVEHTSDAGAIGTAAKGLLRQVGQS